MDILKLIAFILIALILISVLSSFKSEFSTFVRISVCIIVLLAFSMYFAKGIGGIEGIASKVGADIKWFNLVLKLIGIAYLAEFASEICRDAGENSLATKVELCAKAVIFVMAMPIIQSIIDTISKFS